MSSVLEQAEVKFLTVQIANCKNISQLTGLTKIEPLPNSFARSRNLFNTIDLLYFKQKKSPRGGLEKVWFSFFFMLV